MVARVTFGTGGIVDPLDKLQKAMSVASSTMGDISKNLLLEEHYKNQLEEEKRRTDIQKAQAEQQLLQRAKEFDATFNQRDDQFNKELLLKKDQYAFENNLKQKELESNLAYNNARIAESNLRVADGQQILDSKNLLSKIGSDVQQSALLEARKSQYAAPLKALDQEAEDQKKITLSGYGNAPVFDAEDFDRLQRSQGKKTNMMGIEEAKNSFLNDASVDTKYYNSALMKKLLEQGVRHDVAADYVKSLVDGKTLPAGVKDFTAIDARSIEEQEKRTKNILDVAKILKDLGDDTSTKNEGKITPLDVITGLPKELGIKGDEISNSTSVLARAHSLALSHPEYAALSPRQKASVLKLWGASNLDETWLTDPEIKGDPAKFVSTFLTENKPLLENLKNKGSNKDYSDTIEKLIASAVSSGTLSAEDQTKALILARGGYQVDPKTGKVVRNSNLKSASDELPVWDKAAALKELEAKVAAVSPTKHAPLDNETNMKNVTPWDVPSINLIPTEVLPAPKKSSPNLVGIDWFYQPLRNPAMR